MSDQPESEFKAKLSRSDLALLRQAVSKGWEIPERLWKELPELLVTAVQREKGKAEKDPEYEPNVRKLRQIGLLATAMVKTNTDQARVGVECVKAERGEGGGGVELPKPTWAEKAGAKETSPATDPPIPRVEPGEKHEGGQ